VSTTLYPRLHSVPAPLPPGPLLPPAPQEIARSLAGQEDLWRPRIRYAEPRYYTRLAGGRRWEAWLLTWLPGQSTGLHDHGGSGGAFAVLSGAVDETLPVEGHLLTRRYRAGQVRAFDSVHVHDVAARGGPAVTLHVYTPRLTTMTRYLLDRGNLVPLVVEAAGEDW
jgi:Cysteine dioxygenase type I